MTDNTVKEHEMCPNQLFGNVYNAGGTWCN